MDDLIVHTHSVDTNTNYFTLLFEFPFYSKEFDSDILSVIED